MDLADGHVAALNKLFKDSKIGKLYKTFQLLERFGFLFDGLIFKDYDFENVLCSGV